MVMIAQLISLVNSSCKMPGQNKDVITLSHQRNWPAQWSKYNTVV
jgi:hypothetical protein